MKLSLASLLTIWTAVVKQLITKYSMYNEGICGLAVVK